MLHNVKNSEREEWAGRGMKDEEANEIKIRSKRKPRSCLQT